MPSKPVSGLEGFTRLCGNAYLRDSHVASDTIREAPSTGPSLIIIFVWMNSPPRTARKYIAGYTDLFPEARLILITSAVADFIWAPFETQYKRLAPVVEAIQADSGHAGGVLLHIFSNGGAQQAGCLAVAYQQKTEQPLPAKAIVLDSSPGQATFSGSTTAFLANLPNTFLVRIPAMAALLVFFGAWWCKVKAMGQKNGIEIAREQLNNTELIAAPGTRCYIYSSTDKVVDAADVEEHSNEAEKKGWTVTREKFVGTPHVSHLRGDEERYWRTIRNLYPQ